MKKRKNIISVVALLVLGVIAFFVAKNEGWFSGGYSTLNKGLSDFGIRDTASVDRMIITTQDENKVELVRKSTSEWEVNGKYKARKDCIFNLLEMAARIKVRSTVGEKSRDNVIKRIAVNYKKIEFFVNGRSNKTYIVGPSAMDNIGTYMVLETPSDGRSAEPYIMEIPGFPGVLDARLFTDENEWRFTGIYNYDYHTIRKVRVTNHEKMQESFVLSVNKKNELSLTGIDDSPVKAFDTVGARGYLMNFQKIHYESRVRLLTKTQVDSMLLQMPYYTVEVTNDKNEKNTVRVYHMPSHSGEKDLDGTLLAWNPERAYAILSTGEAVVVQFHVFDKILRSLQSFYPAAHNPDSRKIR
ncbi:MAG: hypothetical protein ACHQF2_06155 [Flavobacteriales bacterium]